MTDVVLEHFELSFYGAVLYLIESAAVALGSRQAVLEHFPFLQGYWDESARRMPAAADRPMSDRWRDSLEAWEGRVGTDCHLPLRALRRATGLDVAEVTLFMAIGLADEDPRFGVLFESLQGTPGQRRPTQGLLQLWGHPSGERDAVRATLGRLYDLGLVEVANPDAPRSQWALQVSSLVWDALRGITSSWRATWALYTPPYELVPAHQLTLNDDVRNTLKRVPPLIHSRNLDAIVVRGPGHNGRRTLLGALARELGRGVLEIPANTLTKGDDPRWRVLGPLSSLLNALPLVVFDLPPGENAHIPRLAGSETSLGLVLGRHGGLSGPGSEHTLTINLAMPSACQRALHWRRVCSAPAGESGLDEISRRFRLTSGNIARVAALAQRHASLADRTEIATVDVLRASRALNRQSLDTLAANVPAAGHWSDLALDSDTLAELRALERRCRFREQLATSFGAALRSDMTAGVRALFSGPSGTGKTLAVRVLASVLGMDLYRLDLSTVVNKYIGETEKNLNEVFNRAEELDIILLLDEGDALLSPRTSVQNANDRYANLETNYLLQRLECYEGILVVTSNAVQRIDSAFQRRMDVVIDFGLPDAAERFAIWQLHLPTNHNVPEALLEEAARRCSLTGGQIRNAVLHASLLAIDDGGLLSGAHVYSAVRREYRKIGAVCPLRAMADRYQSV
jgi:ATPase family associated with various cellular activities (AAA)